MEGRHDDFCRRALLLLMEVHRDAAPVVRNRNPVVDEDPNGYLRAVTRERLVDTVINDLEDHMVKACSVIGVTDVHTRTLPDSLQAFEHLDAGRIVDVGHGLGLLSRVHEDGRSEPCST